MAKPILSRRSTTIWVPTPDGTMLQLDTEAPRFVREADFIDMVDDYETSLRISRVAEADARQGAAETSRREARWMMIEQRLKKTLSERCGYPVAGAAECRCPRCELAHELYAILKSEPPVGDGFRSEQGLSFKDIPVGTTVFVGPDGVKDAVYLKPQAEKSKE